ncbi:MAG: S41 family peptidase [Acidaminobacteraceae bacterium]
MMKKRNAVIMIIVSIMLTALITASFALTMQLKTEDRVVITAKDYKHYSDLEQRFAKIISLENTLEKNFYKDVDEEKYTDYMLKGLFESLDDPYSVYMTKEEFKDFNEATSGNYAGIGIYVNLDDDGFIEVVSPIEDTPAERAGFKSGDKIVKVNDLDVSKVNFEEAIDTMKGQPGTDVDITVLRGVAKPFVVTVTREIIRVKAVKSEVLENDIGYLRITSFSDNSESEFDNKLKTLLAKDVKALVIDLRGNPGGSLYAVNEIADQLLGEQTIVSLENRAGKVEEYTSDAKKIDLPIAVLVDGGSASASEILTGAIKDSNSGVIIGTTTFGKGLVQSVLSLPDGSGFKLTTSEYFTPNGTNIHKVGIVPDIVLEIEEKEEGSEDSTEDIQLDRAIEELNKKMK